MKISPNYCLVTQRVIAITADSDSDEDRLPDQQTVSGEVYFTPNVASGRAYHLRGEEGNSFTVPLGRVEASIVDGEIVHEGQRGIILFAAGQGSNPDKISYLVEYRNLRAGTIPISLSPMNFDAVPGGEVDLTNATPVTGATPAGTTKGDKGDPFLYEDFTPEQLEDLRGEPGPLTFEDFTPEQLEVLTGPQGEIGPVGPQGEIGPQGEPGPQGEKGDPGPQGDKGDQGIRGATGERGIQGVKGDPGPKGDKGDNGTSVTIAGNVETSTALPTGLGAGDAGTGYITHNDGNLHVWSGTAWMDVGPIRGPQGEKGDPGEKGEIGDTGLEGPQGIPGERGPKGAKGDVGPVGPIGPQGIQGAKGDTGPQGPIGLTGPKGDTGPRGPQGEPGPLTFEDFTPEQLEILRGPQGDTGHLGVGSPEGKFTAAVGSAYTDLDATNGAIRWVKASGTGNTGWRVEYGDTGWRTRDADFLATGSIMIRRINNDVYLKIGTGQWGLFTFHETSPAAEVILPLHFRPIGNEFMDVRYDSTKAVVGTISIQNNGWFSPRMDAGYTDTSRTLQTSVIVYPTDEPWPTSLPGTPY